jgi:hypothetical protein
MSVDEVGFILTLAVAGIFLGIILIIVWRLRK